MFLALVLLVIIGTALATQQVGLSMALGAFLAGLLFAETEYRHEIEVDIEPFKGLLLGLFFISVGMAIDLTEIARNPIWLLASVVGLFLVKSPIIYVLARLFGAARSVALESGILLGQGGEFAFVIVGLAWSLGLIPDATAQFMLIVAGVTMIATPTVAWGAQRIGRVVQRWEAQHGQPEPDLPQDIAGHIIVVGFGRVGRMLGTFLNEEELELLAIDRDADLVAREHAAGTSLYYGDATRPDILKKFGAESAAALVVTMDSPNATERVVAVVRQHWPSLPIYARARDVDHAMRLIRRGATHAVPETTEASLQLSEIVLMGAGVPDQTARSVVEERRQAEQAMVDESRGQTPN
jgi:CPA2 family monovalent cation:H+ antiporter-2